MGRGPSPGTLHSIPGPATPWPSLSHGGSEPTPHARDPEVELPSPGAPMTGSEGREVGPERQGLASGVRSRPQLGRGLRSEGAYGQRRGSAWVCSREIQDRGGPQAEATAGHRPGRQSASWPVVVTPGDGLGLGCPGETGVRAVSPHLCAPLFPAPILTQILLPSEQEGSWDLRLPPPNSGTESGGPSMQTGDRDLRAPSPPAASPQPTPNPGIDSRPPGPSPCLDLGQIDPGGAGTRVLLV